MTSFHRVFSRAPWSLFPSGRVLAAAIIELTARGPIVVAMDDTTAQHKGKKVYGKGCHHDAVRSTHTHTAYRWGHKWVVLAILQRLMRHARINTTMDYYVALDTDDLAGGLWRQHGSGATFGDSRANAAPHFDQGASRPMSKPLGE